MSASNNRQSLETKYIAFISIKRILKGNGCRFQMNRKVNETAKLRSQRYNDYFFICHSNTEHSPRWQLCRLAENGGCSLEKALFFFNTVQAGTSRLQRHT